MVEGTAQVLRRNYVNRNRQTPVPLCAKGSENAVIRCLPTTALFIHPREGTTSIRLLDTPRTYSTTSAATSRISWFSRSTVRRRSG